MSPRDLGVDFVRFGKWEQKVGRGHCTRGVSSCQQDRALHYTHLGPFVRSRRRWWFTVEWAGTSISFCVCCYSFLPYKVLLALYGHLSFLYSSPQPPPFVIQRFAWLTGFCYTSVVGGFDQVVIEWHSSNVTWYGIPWRPSSFHSSKILTRQKRGANAKFAIIP